MAEADLVLINRKLREAHAMPESVLKRELIAHWESERFELRINTGLDRYMHSPPTYDLMNEQPVRKPERERA